MKRWQVVEWLTLMWPVFFFGSTPDIKNTFTAQLLDYDNNNNKKTQKTHGLTKKKKKNPTTFPTLFTKYISKTSKSKEGRKSMKSVV